MIRFTILPKKVKVLHIKCCAPLDLETKYVQEKEKWIIGKYYVSENNYYFGLNVGDKYIVKEHNVYELD